MIIDLIRVRIVVVEKGPVVRSRTGSEGEPSRLDSDRDNRKSDNYEHDEAETGRKSGEVENGVVLIDFSDIESSS